MNTVVKVKVALLSLLLLATSCAKKTSDATTMQRQDQQEMRQPRRGNNTQQSKRPTAGELIAQLDANKDGKLEKLEAKGPIAQDFDKLDKDQDGFLSVDEIEAAGPPQRRNRR